MKLLVYELATIEYILLHTCTKFDEFDAPSVLYSEGPGFLLYAYTFLGDVWLNGAGAIFTSLFCLSDL